MGKTIIAIDAMGGDHGPAVILRASILAIKRNPDLHLILVGDEAKLRRYLRSVKGDFQKNLSIHHASQQVAMGELPSQALRYKKDSSMRVAVNLVKEGGAQACVSAGNTGALMATARFVLKTIPGIERPAIMAALPTVHDGKPAYVLDLGANVDSSSDNLFQFAVMGSIVTEHVYKVPSPRVGLLNIGEEEIKGNYQVKQTAELLSKCDAINYVGYVEADRIFSGEVDVIVCDGFVGNVALKASEGILKFIMSRLRLVFKNNVLMWPLGLLLYPILQKVKKDIDPRNYNGASLLGLRGIVIKSHGSADAKSFATAINAAVAQVEQNVPEQIRNRVIKILETNGASCDTHE